MRPAAAWCVAASPTRALPFAAYCSLFVELPHFLMERRMLLGIKERVERATAGQTPQIRLIGRALSSKADERAGVRLTPPRSALAHPARNSSGISSLRPRVIKSDLDGDPGALVAARDRVAGSLPAPQPHAHASTGVGEVSPPALVLGRADHDGHTVAALLVADREGELPAAPAADPVISAVRRLSSP